MNIVALLDKNEKLINGMPEGFQPTGLKKVFSTPDLIRLLKHARYLKFDGRGLNYEKFFESLDPNGYHSSGVSFYHKPALEFWKEHYPNGEHPKFDFKHNNGVNVRAYVMCKVRGLNTPLEQVFDLDQHDFEALKDYDKFVAEMG